MTHDELLAQLTSAQAELTKWQQTIRQCDEISRDILLKRRNAELQVAFHEGHLQRISLWLKGFEDANDN